MTRHPEAPAKAVIFDMDGVLVDSTEAHYQAWLALARQRGLMVEREAFHQTIGSGTVDTGRAIFGPAVAEAELPALGLQKEELYRQMARQHLVIMNGAPELVAALVGAGWRVAVGSSAPLANVEIILDRFPTGKLFHAVSHAGLVRNTKPAPDVFLKAAELLDVPPGRCIVIEDSLAGLEAARRGGMAAGIGLTTTLSREALGKWARLVVDSLREVHPGTLEALL